MDKGPALIPECSNALSLTARCLSSLSGFESGSRPAEEVINVVLGYSVGFPMYSEFLRH